MFDFVQVDDHLIRPVLKILSLSYTPSFPKYLTSLTFLNMFDRSSYSKTFVKCVKLHVYIKIYLRINQIIGKELIII